MRVPVSIFDARLWSGCQMMAQGDDSIMWDDQPYVHRLETAVRYVPAEDCPNKARMVDEIRAERLARRAS
jgi:hypothetical protein